FCLRAVIATFAPRPPSASAICSPSPREPPVIKAVRPLKSKSCLRLMEYLRVSALAWTIVRHHAERDGTDAAAFCHRCSLLLLAPAVEPLRHDTDDAEDDRRAGNCHEQRRQSAAEVNRDQPTAEGG